MPINSTLTFIERIKDTKFERTSFFEYFFATALILLLITSNLIAWSLIKLINNRDQRQIDKLIKFQTIVLNVTGRKHFSLLWKTILMKSWPFQQKHVILYIFLRLLLLLCLLLLRNSQSFSIERFHRWCWLQHLWYNIEFHCWICPKSVILHGPLPLPLHNALWFLWQSCNFWKGK